MPTLKQLKQELRFRLGESEEGSWTSETPYETNLDDTDNVDELKLAIETAEQKVCEDCFQNEKPLLIGSDVIRLEAGKYQYPLPTDFIGMIMLQQLNDGVFYTIPSGRVSIFLDNFDPSSKNTLIDAYDIQGSVATRTLITEGVATGGSNTTCVDADNSGFGTPTADVDIIENLRDKSTATITSVATTTATFSAGLTGGISNTFRAGDRYRVLSAEKTSLQLFVWPPPSGTDYQLHVSDTGTKTTTTTVDSSTTQSRSFTTTDPIVLASIIIDINAISTESQPITLRIETDSGGSPTGTLASTSPASVTAIDVPATGENEAFFPYGIELAAGTYHFVASTIESGSYDLNNSANGEKHKLYGWSGEESLKATYAKYPRKFTSGTTGTTSTTGDNEDSEIPLIAKEAVILWAMYLCLSKLHMANIAVPKIAETRRLYEFEVQKIMDRLAAQSVTAFDSVKNVYNFRTSRGIPDFLRLDFPVVNSS